jgi:hypothetical protein
MQRLREDRRWLIERGTLTDGGATVCSFAPLSIRFRVQNTRRFSELVADWGWDAGASIRGIYIRLLGVVELSGC